MDKRWATMALGREQLAAVRMKLEANQRLLDQAL